MIFLVLSIFTLISPYDIGFSKKFFSPYLVSFSGINLVISDTSSFWISAFKRKVFCGLSFKNHCDFCADSTMYPLGFYVGKSFDNRFFGSSFDFGFFSRESSYYGDLLGYDKRNYFRPSFYLSWLSSKNINLFKVTFQLYNFDYVTPTDTSRVYKFQYKFSYVNKLNLTPQWYTLSEFSLGKTINKRSVKTIQQFSNFDSSSAYFNLGGEFRMFYNPFSHTFLSPGILFSTYGDSLNLQFLFSGYYEISRYLGLISDLIFELNSKSVFLYSTEVCVRKMYWKTAALGLRFSKEFLSLDFLFDPFKKAFLSSTLQIRFAK